MPAYALLPVVALCACAPTEADKDGAAGDSGETGQACPAQASVTPAEIAFGAVAVGEVESADLTLSNTGCADLHVLNIRAEGDRDDFEVGAITSVIVLSGSPATLPISFTPQEVAPRGITVRIETDDASEAEILVSVTGEGI